MRNTIKKHIDFIQTDGDLSISNRFFLVRVKKAKIPDDPRYGLIVTKKTFKHAVDRNRAKRMIRDWLRFNEQCLEDDLDYIFIIRHAILGASREEGRAEMKKALKYIKKQKLGKSE